MNASNYPPLTPVTAPWMNEMVQDKQRLEKLFGQYDSPINLLHAGPFVDNIQAYTAVLNRHKLKHTIFFARKANKCRIFVKEAARHGIGVDTASYQELEQSLALGCKPEKLVLTAAIKDEKLIRLALENDVLIILDNEDECLLVNQLAEQLGGMAKVGIRISGFRVEDQKLYSRFGFDMEKAAAFIINKIGADKQFSKLRFEGLQFHLDGYSIKQRGAALVQAIQLADKLMAADIGTSFIDIGGGLLTNYLADASEWAQFWEELKKAVRRERDPITFGNNGLGYQMINGQLRGTPDVYPYYNDTPKAAFLDAVLSHKNKEGVTTSSLLQKRDIELRMEPGRSLLDQTGMTVAKVVHRKQDQRGDWLIGLNMNRSQLSSSSADFLLDPIFIPTKSSGKKLDAVAVYFTGAYCLEQDVILKRKIVLPHIPEPGDIIAFPNTAGYMMHFYETRSHLHPFTKNLVTGAAPAMNFVLDTEVT